MNDSISEIKNGEKILSSEIGILINFDMNHKKYSKGIKFNKKNMTKVTTKSMVAAYIMTWQDRIMNIIDKEFKN